MSTSQPQETSAVSVSGNRPLVPSSDGDTTSWNSKQPETSSLSWQPLVVTSKEQIFRLWQRFSETPFALDDLSKDMPLEQFFQILMNKTNVFYELGDEQGLIIATNVRPYLDAIIHVMFFDRKIRGREETVADALAHLIDVAKLRRVSMLIVANNSVMQRFVERLGFVEEGTMRQSHLYNGRYYDRKLYGLLREELR